ncbi:hypothetical protein HN419_03145 [Candidatus Woesearchaeota archaeon]|nr:hypothetical protein [Candidatus Woesearchaeota archaeon]MBT3537007.1 hypothetical protein [Candidatus Woesearchaeota archaeon]MBT4697617.1 hypothetical protein [Candidatus Woesearchaeota archaeon]MBT4717731.1 hypothetical protein [Candidatus Woesearchaeota archaeon]MBT7106683.1 hypothetical protein [Candidatus Woesearchaeota archaeon]
MKKEKLSSTLENIGLTKGEITIYFSLLELGSTTTGKIIENAQISSGKIYEILDKLINKGLVNYIVKGKIKYFNAATPDSLLEFVEEKKSNLEKREKEIRNILPDLKELHKFTEEESCAVVYKGIKGLKHAADLTLEHAEPGDEYTAMGLVEHKPEKFNLFWRQFHQKRAEKGVKTRLLFAEESERYAKQLKNIPLSEVRVLKSVSASAVTLIGPHLKIIDYDSETTIYIKNKYIAKSFKAFFESLWKLGDKV